MGKLKAVLVIVTMLICINACEASEKSDETTSRMRITEVGEYVTLCDVDMQYWQTDYTSIEREDMTVGDVVAVKVNKVNNIIISIQIVRR